MPQQLDVNTMAAAHVESGQVKDWRQPAAVSSNLDLLRAAWSQPRERDDNSRMPTYGARHKSLSLPTRE